MTALDRITTNLLHPGDEVRGFYRCPSISTCEIPTPRTMGFYFNRMHGISGLAGQWTSRWRKREGTEVKGGEGENSRRNDTQELGPLLFASRDSRYLEPERDWVGGQPSKVNRTIFTV